ncbi:uracil-DNA glycosylase, partial [Bordetella pertussis]
MSAPEAAAPAAPRPNPLQRIWLREIGIEKTWLPAPLASAA